MRIIPITNNFYFDDSVKFNSCFLLNERVVLFLSQNYFTKKFNYRFQVLDIQEEGRNQAQVGAITFQDQTSEFMFVSYLAPKFGGFDMSGKYSHYYQLAHKALGEPIDEEALKSRVNSKKSRDFNSNNDDSDFEHCNKSCFEALLPYIENLKL